MSDWLHELEEAVDQLRLDRLEALATRVPDVGALDQARARSVMRRLSALAGRVGETEVARLGWLLSAVLMQPVVEVPRRSGRTSVPLMFIGAAVVLGLVIGRTLAAAVMAVGLVLWAIRYGGTVRERHGAWLRLGDSIFDLRTVRKEHLGDAWLLLEGRRVPIEAVRELAPELLRS